MASEASNLDASENPESCKLEGKNTELPKELLEDLDRCAQEYCNQLAGPTKEEAQKRFEKEITAFAEAVNAGKDDEARAAMFKAFMIAGADVMRDPSPDMQLAVEAQSCIEARDWAGAEAAMNKRLELDVNSGDLALVVKVHYDLSRLFHLIGRPEEAWSHACLASEMARRADIMGVTTLILDHEAALALERNNIARALAAASEALSLLTQERIFDHWRSRALTARAACLLANGDIIQAEHDLKSSSEFLGTSLFGGIASGPTAARARWFEVHAELCLRQGNRTEALHELREATELRRKLAGGCCGPAPYSLVAHAKCLERFAEIVQQDGDANAALDALAQARSLRDRAHVASGT